MKEYHGLSHPSSMCAFPEARGRRPPIAANPHPKGQSSAEERGVSAASYGTAFEKEDINPGGPCWPPVLKPRCALFSIRHSSTRWRSGIGPSADPTRCSERWTSGPHRSSAAGSFSTSRLGWV